MWYSKAILAVFCVILVDLTLGGTSDTLKVQLNHGGVLIGRHMETAKGRHIRSFLGIPYAKPPLDDLRFKSPVPYPSWEGVKLAVKDSAVCPQIDQMQGSILTGNEDCLYINVYTPPLDAIKKASGKLPVMVYIHGGGWSMGSGAPELYGPEYFMEHDVILVIGNYRLGALGFLSAETVEYPGNYGLKDQLEILKWVQNHISSFGGDKDSVTIFGESAGGGSVSHHLQSPKSKGLFHRAIQQSGTIFNPWAYPKNKGDAAKNALKLANLFKCDVEGENWTTIIECLRKIDALELAQAEPAFYEWLAYPSCTFAPVLEPEHPEAFLDHLPRDTGVNSLDIPVMMGIVSDEGLLGTAPFLGIPDLLKELQSKATEMLPMMFFYRHLKPEQQTLVTKEIEGFYLKNGHSYEKSNHRNFTDLFSDAYFTAGFDEYLEKRLTQESTTTYVYVYDHRPAGSLTNLMGGGDESLGVCHADELALLFPVGKLLFPTGVPTEKDILLREAMVTMWVNFATYGNPTPSGSTFKWEPTTKYPWNYARLGSQDLDNWYILQNEDNYARDRFDFWRNLRVILENGKNLKDEL
ncbi:CES5A.2 family protein [Megaselia abdita]